MSDIRTQLAQAKRPLVIAHRGDWTDHPENSCAAIAAAQRFDMVEIDIRLSADREPMVIHDDTLLRTTGDPRPIKTLTAQELCTIHLLDSPETVPHLEQALAAGGDGLLYDIDVKDEADIETVARFLAPKPEREKCLLKIDVKSSCDVDRLKALEARYGMTIIAKLSLDGPSDLGLIQEMADRSIAGAEVKFADLSILAQAACAGLPLTSLTLRDVHCLGLSDDLAIKDPHSVWGALGKAGLKGIMTDTPSELMAFLDAGGSCIAAPFT